MCLKTQGITLKNSHRGGCLRCSRPVLTCQIAPLPLYSGRAGIHGIDCKHHTRHIRFHQSYADILSTESFLLTIGRNASCPHGAPTPFQSSPPGHQLLCYQDKCLTGRRTMPLEILGSTRGSNRQLRVLTECAACARSPVHYSMRN